ncbi:hypothetical protein [Winogradskyella helgolandensis]|uniref:hypothetical protein n=1 Tax=Winogradskyella helgolandensis TaxID=2697010 RepID=UPI0015CCD8D1|nr:hypothetical protein [Winogradskyella helgolandensis]
MKSLRIVFLFITSSVFAQVNFQEGYFIDNSNTKVECFIKNLDWKRNPQTITYRLTKDASEETLSSSQLKEFRIYETDNFYRRYTINKELVGLFIEEMQLSTNFVLLKVLVDGQFNLYELHTNSNYYFFYKKKAELVLLDYKKTVDKNNTIRESSKFKKQLYDNFKCDDFKLKDYSNLRYNSTNLSDFFSEFNECYGGEYVNLQNQRTKAKVSFKVRGGLNLISSQTNKNSYILSYTIPPWSANPISQDVSKSFTGVEKYDSSNNFSLGIELEVRLPFVQNKWSVFAAPNYQNVSETYGSASFSETNIADFKITSNLSYSFIQIPIGLRRYFYVNDRLEIYANIAYIQNLVLSSDESTQISDVPTSSRPYSFGAKVNRETASSSGGSLGIGFVFLGKYGLDINYYGLNLNLKDDFQLNMKGIAINASYTIL